jgi:hypothetical protein
MASKKARPFTGRAFLLETFSLLNNYCPVLLWIQVVVVLPGTHLIKFERPRFTRQIATTCIKGSICYVRAVL